MATAQSANNHAVCVLTGGEGEAERQESQKKLKNCLEQTHINKTPAQTNKTRGSHEPGQGIAE